MHCNLSSTLVLHVAISITVVVKQHPCVNVLGLNSYPNSMSKEKENEEEINRNFLDYLSREQQEERM